MEKEIYLYPYSATEARARNELALWRASFCANVECARDIEEGIRTHFDGAHLDDAFLQPLVDKWGYSLLICFKDGTEITQAMQRRQTA